MQATATGCVIEVHRLNVFALVSITCNEIRLPQTLDLVSPAGRFESVDSGFQTDTRATRFVINDDLQQ